MNQKCSCLNKWCQIIILFTIILLNISACCASSNKNCTEYVRSFEKVLSRKRRFLAFLKGSNVIVSNFFISLRRFIFLKKIFGIFRLQCPTLKQL